VDLFMLEKERYNRLNKCLIKEYNKEHYSDTNFQLLGGIIERVTEKCCFLGETGAFSFYNPENDLYFTGTINQSNSLGHSTAYNAIIKSI